MPVNTPGPSLLDALKERVVVADGAMGTMLQAADLTSTISPDWRAVTRSSMRPGQTWSRACMTPTSGRDPTPWRPTLSARTAANLGEYDIVHRIRELAQAGAVLARKSPLTGPLQIGRAGFSDRSGRGRSCRRSATRHYARAARRVPGAGRRHDRRRRGRDHRRNLPRPCCRRRRQSSRSKRAMAAAGVRRAADRPRDRGDNAERCCSARRSAPR